MATYLHEFLKMCPKITNMSTQQENEKARFSTNDFFFFFFFLVKVCAFIEPEKECRAGMGGGGGGGGCGLHENKETQKSLCYTTAKHYVGPVVTEQRVGTKSPQVKKNKKLNHRIGPEQQAQTSTDTNIKLHASLPTSVLLPQP